MTLSERRLSAGEKAQADGLARLVQEASEGVRIRQNNKWHGALVRAGLDWKAIVAIQKEVESYGE